MERRKIIEQIKKQSYTKRASALREAASNMPLISSAAAGASGGGRGSTSSDSSTIALIIEIAGKFGGWLLMSDRIDENGNVIYTNSATSSTEFTNTSRTLTISFNTELNRWEWYTDTSAVPGGQSNVLGGYSDELLGDWTAVGDPGPTSVQVSITNIETTLNIVPVIQYTSDDVEDEGSSAEFRWINADITIGQLPDYYSLLSGASAIAWNYDAETWEHISSGRQLGGTRNVPPAGEFAISEDATLIIERIEQ